MHNDLIGQKASPNGRKALPLRGKWLDDADEVLSYLEGHRDSHKPEAPSALPMETTLQLLKQAHDIIEQADARINELEALSSLDPLTGLASRRGFMEFLSRELDRIKRDPAPDVKGGLLVMIDLDNYVAIQKSCGVDAGNEALKVTAQTLANDIRPMDIAARLTGDEFVILFANTTRKEALERAQLLIKRLNSLSFIWRGEGIPVRASLGLKEYTKGASIERILSAVDASLAENKIQLNKSRIKQDNKTM